MWLKVDDSGLYIHHMNILKECCFFWLIYIIFGTLLLQLSDKLNFVEGMF